MAEETKKDSKSKTIIILLIIIIVLMIGGAAAFLLLNGNNGGELALVQDSPIVSQAAVDNAPILRYDDAAVALDADSLQKAVDEAFSKTKDGYITLDFKNEAFSDDGENFKCRVGNAPENTADMYFTIYLDDTYSEQLYLSGLIRPGAAIESFKSEKKLDPGTYDAILVLTQVKDDHATLKGETSVYLKLNVG